MVNPNLDSVTTIRPDGSHRILHPSDAKGRFNTWRRAVFAILILIYVLLPWIPVRGAPAVFFNAAERKVHLFGHTLVFQDLWLGFFLITGLGFGLFYITALFGRVWCGWACPQTVWLEGVYRRIERWIEGDGPKRERLAAAPNTADKIFKRVLKHGLFILVSLFIAHVFISYFISLPRLYSMMRTSPLENWTAFLWVFTMSGIFYFNFAWFREQLCIVICPYGRLQSALIDDNSLVIGYDTARGEPRGKPGTAGAGDCVDCFRCVQVCPTGIDIRQGLQMECIGCSACIDACDDVMTKLKRPRGLIRYDSQNGLTGGKTKFLRPRTLVYTVMLLAGITVFSFALSSLEPFTATVHRMQGSPYYRQDGLVRNQFQMRLTNKSAEPASLTIEVSGGDHALTWNRGDGMLQLEGMEERVLPLFVSMSAAEFAGAFPLTIIFENPDNGHRVEKTVPFLGPDQPANPPTP